MRSNIVLFGSPGAGKGVQAELLARNSGAPHLSTGELLRRESASDQPLGRRIRSLIDEGRFLDDETMLDLLQSELEQPRYESGFILDGFPRTPYQAQRFENLLGGTAPPHALLIRVSEEVALRRLSGRRTCSRCGASYHLEFRPPERAGRCDRCQTKLERRKDDDDSFHAERLRSYRELTRPVLEHYRLAEQLIEVDGERPIEVVAEDIRTRLQALWREESARSGADGPEKGPGWSGALGAA